MKVTFLHSVEIGSILDSSGRYILQKESKQALPFFLPYEYWVCSWGQSWCHQRGTRSERLGTAEPGDSFWLERTLNS